MLNGLRHYALISGNNQHYYIYTSHTGQHIFNEFSCLGDYRSAPTQAIRQHQRHKARHNGHTALFLLRETVSIDAGQGGGRFGLAMIDMPGCADDDMSGVDKGVLSLICLPLFIIYWLLFIGFML